jgi:hypothetical protein
LPPPGNQRKPGQQQVRYDEEPDHPTRQRYPTPTASANRKLDRSRATDACLRGGPENAAIGKDVLRLHIGPWREPAFSPRRGSRAGPRPGARQRNSWSTTALPFLKGPRCTAPPHPTRRRERASSAAGHRQSRLPATRRPISPKEERPGGWSSPGSTSEEAGSRTGRAVHPWKRHCAARAAATGGFEAS